MKVLGFITGWVAACAITGAVDAYINKKIFEEKEGED